MKNLRVKNWDKFQHYKDRNPPWIKLHFEILSSRDWVMISDASKLLAIVIMLIASRNGGEIPEDAEYIRRVSYLQNVDFKPLIECGFLEYASISKQMLASARPEKETESYRTDTETERTHSRFKNRGSKNAKITGSEEGRRIAEKILSGSYDNLEA